MPSWGGRLADVAGTTNRPMLRSVGQVDSVVELPDFCANSGSSARNVS